MMRNIKSYPNSMFAKSKFKETPVRQLKAFLKDKWIVKIVETGQEIRVDSWPEAKKLIAKYEK